jgi:hypothetical protein
VTGEKEWNSSSPLIRALIPSMRVKMSWPYNLGVNSNTWILKWHTFRPKQFPQRNTIQPDLFHLA